MLAQAAAADYKGYIAGLFVVQFVGTEACREFAGNSGTGELIAVED